MVAVFLIICVSACAPFTQYRTKYEVCRSQALPPSPECETHALQQLPDAKGSDYLLGFIEFDDQGQLWDRQQMWAVFDKLARDSASRDLLLVVFVHGWKHSAAPDDGNITTFRNVLAQLSETEANLSEVAGVAPRQVAGIYLGWRGGSVEVPLVKELSFWERKNTAQKVGHGGVTEVLARLERLKRDKQSMGAVNSRMRLVVVGHSFGGAVVNAAVSQILEKGFVDTVGPDGVQTDVAGFGDLVVLINPAFEALRFSTLSDMAAERGRYFESQLPVAAVLTSEADYATRYAFPLGRWFSTRFEKEREIKRRNAVTREIETIDEDEANVAAVGHFTPYRTHRLYPTDERTREQIARAALDKSARAVIETGSAWADDRPGSKINFDGLVLERTSTSAGRNPYLVVYVDKDLITDHNDIDDPRVIHFLARLIMLSSRGSEQADKALRGVKP